MAKWNDKQLAIHAKFSERFQKLIADEGKTYTTMSIETGLGAATIFGLQAGTLAPRIDHLPFLHACFGDKILDLVTDITLEGLE